MCVKHYLLGVRKPGFANDKVRVGFVICWPLRIGLGSVAVVATVVFEVGVAVRSAFAVAWEEKKIDFFVPAPACWVVRGVIVGFVVIGVVVVVAWKHPC